MGLIVPLVPAPSLTKVLTWITSFESQDPITKKVPTMFTQVITEQTRAVVRIDSVWTALAPFKQYQQVFLTYSSIALVLASSSSSVIGVSSSVSTFILTPLTRKSPLESISIRYSPCLSLREMMKGSIVTGAQMVSTSWEQPLPNLTKVLICDSWVDLSHEAIQRNVPTTFLQMKKLMKRSGLSMLAWYRRLDFLRQYQQALLISLSTAGTISLICIGCSGFPATLNAQSSPQHGFSLWSACAFASAAIARTATTTRVLFIKFISEKGIFLSFKLSIQTS